LVDFTYIFGAALLVGNLSILFLCLTRDVIYF